jgi:hypothetical protein
MKEALLGLFAVSWSEYEHEQSRVKGKYLAVIKTAPK